MERQAAELCRFACQHGQTGHEKVQKRAVPQVRGGGGGEGRGARKMSHFLEPQHSYKKVLQFVNSFF